MSTIPIALQMYTLRDASSADFRGTLSKVAEIGYDAIELAGNGGLSASELKALLGDLGLQCLGSHTGFEELEADTQKVIDYNLGIGNPYVVVPWLGEQYRGDAAGWKAMGARFAQLGAKLKDAGLTLCYHNHAFEFEVEENGVPGLDLFYDNAPADLLAVELDTYWVKFAGQDPAAYVAKYRDRLPLVHIKDMTAGDAPTFTEVGTGIMDFPAIFAAAEGGAVKAWIVEQDQTQIDPVESVTISYRNLRELLGR